MARPSIQVELESASDLVEHMSDEELGAIMQRVGKAIVRTWKSAVQGAMLPGMARPIFSSTYARGLTAEASLAYPFHGDVHTGAVTWVAPEGSNADLPGIVENGYAAFDIKPGLLAGPKSRRMADGKGRYNIVPFRWFTPGATGRYGGAVMPSWVHELAKGLEYSVSAGPGAGSRTVWGGRLAVPEHRAIVGHQSPWADASRGPAGRPAEHTERTTADPESVGEALPDYEWQSSPFEGMARMGQKTSGGGMQTGGYWTFRAVSSDSDPASWIHPGVSPNPIMRAVGDQLPQIVNAILGS